MAKKETYFPLKDVGKCCSNKWGWSTIWLNAGTTSSCHRVEQVPIDFNNFDNFHNLPKKIEDREKMLRGEWPHGSDKGNALTADRENGCQYCQRIEESGGISDRLQVNDQFNYESHINELESDPMATHVTPTTVEIFAENTCNLRCIYCSAGLSSRIDDEDKKFGPILFRGEHPLTTSKGNVDHAPLLMEKFLDWLDKNIQSLARLHLLGGETYIQHKLLESVFDILERNPNPTLCLNIFSNFNAPRKYFYTYNERIKDLQSRGHLQRFDLTFSIDCWGPQQSYVRSGLDLDLAEEYWAWACNEKIKGDDTDWLYLNINQTIGSMTIKTMPDLIEMIYKHSGDKLVGHYFSFLQGFSFQQAEIFDWSLWEEDFERILGTMKRDTENQQDAYDRMLGIRDTYKKHCKRNEIEIEKLHCYLDELDRRRGTDWRSLFPYLK